MYLANKKIIALASILLLAIILSSTNVSAFEFDNVVNYKDGDKVVSIVNAFGFGEELGNATLTSHQTISEYKTIIPGKDRAVMYYEFDFKEIYENGLGEVTFTNVKNGRNLNKKYYFAKAIYKTEVIPRYKEVCNIEFSEFNKTNQNVCRNEIIEYLEKTVIDKWEKLGNNNIPDEKQTIALIVDVYAGETVDGVWTIAGKKIDKHAVWTPALDVDLEAWWHLNESTGNATNSVNISQHNGTVVGNPTQGIAGLINNSFEFDGVGDYLTTDKFTQLEGRQNFTVSYWVNWSDTKNKRQSTISMEDSVDGFAPIGVTRGNGAGDNDLDSVVCNNAACAVVTYTEDPSLEQWIHYVVRYNGTDVSLFVNGTELGTTALTGDTDTSNNDLWIGNNPASADREINGTMEEIGIFLRAATDTEISDLYNDGAAIAPPEPGPTAGDFLVNLLTPTDNTLTNVTALNFTAELNATGIWNVTNGTIYIWNSTGDLINQTTNILSGNLTNVSTWEVSNFIDDTYNWSVLGWFVNTTGQFQSNWSINGNFTFTIDSTEPQVRILSPNDTINYGYGGLNLTINFSTSDTNLDTCWLTYGTSQFNISCTQNTSIIVEGLLESNITLYANDTLGNQNNTVQTLSYFVFEGNTTYKNSTLEGSVETYIQNITITGTSLDSIAFFYEDNISSPTTAISGDITILTQSNFVTPSVTQDTNKSFFWAINLSNGINVNLNNRTQTILNFDVGNCTTYSNLLFNFTLVDEEQQTVLTNTDIEVAFNIFASNNINVVVNFSQASAGNSYGVCFNTGVPSGTSYLVDGVIRYEADDHAIEYYNIADSVLGNTTKGTNITLFDLALNDSTDFQLTFTGSDFLPVAEALVFVDRQYVSENRFKTVELPITDSNGQSILHLVRNDVIYNIRILKNGEVLGNFEKLTAFCEDIVIGNCKITLNAQSSTEEVFDYNQQLGITFTAPSYNNETGLVTFTYLTVDGSSKTVLMNVTRSDVFGNRTICSDSITSAGSTLQCNTSGIDDTSLLVIVSVDNQEVLVKIIDVANLGFGVAGAFVFLIMAINLIFMFSGSKSGILWGIVISFAAGTSLGLIQGELIGFGAGGLWIILVAIIGMWKLNKGRQQ